MENHTLLALVVAFSSALVLAFRKSKKPFSNVPGPVSQSWLFGNMLELILYSPYGKYEFNWQKQYGTVYSIKGCIGEDRLMVSDSTALRHILADTGDFRKSPQHQFVNGNVFGSGSVLFVFGQSHRRIRNVMAPAFSTSALRDMIPILHECAHQMAEKWEQKLESASNGIINVFPHMHETTLKAVSKCVVGYDATEDADYTKAYDNLVITGAKRSKLSILTHSITLALPSWVVDVMKVIPPRDFRTLLKHRDASDRRADIFLNKKIEARNLGIEPEKDLFDVMLEKHVTSPENISLEEIKHQFGTITVAGEDTTANAALWALYELAKNPQWQDKIRDEVAEADDGTERSLEFYDRLPFLNALIKEVLRFYPTVPYTERLAIRDTMVPVSQPITTRDGKQITEILVQKGQYIEVAITSFNRHPSMWGPDAGIFQPTRWLDQSGKLSDGALGPYANLLTFIGGPRTCLGWRFAVLEIQVLVSDLLRKFALSLPDNSIIETAHAISLVPIHNGGKIELPLKIKCL